MYCWKSTPAVFHSTHGHTPLHYVHNNVYLRIIIIHLTVYCVALCRQLVRTYVVMASRQNASRGTCSSTLRRQHPRLSMYARERIRQLLSGGSTCAEVVTALRQDGNHTCRQTVWRLERYINEHGTIKPLPKSGRPTDVTLHAAMMQDDETTAKKLVTSLRGSGVSISMSTALKGRRLLGWTSRGTAYCQLVRAQNREKRLLWAQEYLGTNFDDVIWTDETSIQMETHRRFCCRKNGQKLRYKPRPKHPVMGWNQLEWSDQGLHF